MGICLNACRCGVWKPPHKSIQPIFYRYLLPSLCLLVWKHHKGDSLSSHQKSILRTKDDSTLRGKLSPNEEFVFRFIYTDRKRMRKRNFFFDLCRCSICTLDWILWFYLEEISLSISLSLKGCVQTARHQHRFYLCRHWHLHKGFETQLCRCRCQCWYEHVHTILYNPFFIGVGQCEHTIM